MSPAAPPPRVVVVVAAGEARPPGLEAVEAVARLEVVDDEHALRAALRAGAEVVGVWDFRSTLLHTTWSDASGVRWVHAASSGLDAVPRDLAGRDGVVVTNARGTFDRGIAEHVLLMVLAFAKDLPGTIEDGREARWRHRENDLVQGRRLLVVGAGSIGATVARLARAVGLRPTGVARRARPHDPDFDRVVAVDDLHAALAEADDVVITAPLTAATRGLFDAAAFAAMRPGARLVNVGRGGIVDEAALLDALESGHLGGAALDVVAEEPLPADDPLWRRRDVIITPHNAGDTVGWQQRLAAAFAANLGRYRDGVPLDAVVPPPTPEVP